MLDALPFAVAIALSPFPVVPAILLLFSERPRPASSGFLGGWLLGILSAAAIFAVFSDVLQFADESPRWISLARLVIGALLVILGVVAFVKREAKSESPAWMQSLSTATPVSAFRLGVLLSVANPKVLLLAAAAGIAVGGGDLQGWSEVLALLLFTVVGSATVAIPVLAYALGGERVLTPLAGVRDRLIEHNAAIVAVVLVILGVLVAVKGYQGL